MHPPYTAIRAFDAAARHLSFKLAADELGVTPTAISHQIRQLEASAGKSLFVRSTRKIELTDDGTRFAQEIGGSLRTLQLAYTRLCEAPERSCVTLGVSSLFAARWLVPKLGDFWEKHPDIDFKFFHTHLPIWQQFEHYDVAIAWGVGDWPDLKTKRFLSVEASPVLSAELYKKSGPFRKPSDLLSLPLLHFRERLGWARWLELAGLQSTSCSDGTVFEDANVELQAALSGRGVSLGNFPLINEEVASGRLVRPFDLTIKLEAAYQLVLPESNQLPYATSALIEWLLEQIE